MDWILIALFVAIIYSGTGVWVSWIRSEVSLRQLKRLEADCDRKAKADLKEMRNILATYTLNLPPLPSDEDTEDRWVHDLLKEDK